MKKHFTRLAALVIAAASLASMAQAQAKIGTVNSKDIFEKSAEGKRIMARLREVDTKNQADLAKLDEEIRGLQTRLSTQRLTLSEDAAQQLSSDIDKKSTDRKRRGEDAGAAWSALRDRLFQTLQTELIAVIAQIGKEKGYDLIMDIGNGAVYANPAIDLSAEVIKRYDAQKAVPAK